LCEQPQASGVDIKVDEYYMTSEPVFKSESIQNTSSVFSPENKTIQDIIAELEALIDQINTNFASARGLILELARKLNETKQCELTQICRRIKEILKNKIREGKITERWIEECLPQEYKRNYNKSEQTSLSRKAKKLQEIIINNKGNVYAESISPTKSSIRNVYSTAAKGDTQLDLPEDRPDNLGDYHKDEVQCTRCQNLEEALIKASPISTAEYLSENKIKFIIPRDRYKEIKSAMRRSNNSFLLIVDGTRRTLGSVEPDTLG
jgi:hypothetical protein